MQHQDTDVTYRLLTLIESLNIDNQCFSQQESFGYAIYVKDAEAEVFELDSFSKHRLTFDRVLAIQFPTWLKEFALEANWILTPNRIGAYIELEQEKFMFVFNIETPDSSNAFDDMMNTKSEWNVFVTDSKANLPLAITKRHCKKLYLSPTIKDMFKHKG